jgi:hypothetical protein
MRAFALIILTFNLALIALTIASFFRGMGGVFEVMMLIGNLGCAGLMFAVARAR